MAKIPGQLEDAQLHNKTADPVVLPTGKIWIRTDTADIKVYDGSATRTLVTKDTTQTLTGKTLSGNTASSLVNGSGTVNVNSSGTVTLPNTTDTLVGKATTDTFTNKTIDALGTGNSITNIADTNVKAAAGIALNKLAATTINRALVSDGTGFVSPATTTATEIGFVNGVTSSIQTQINAQVPKSTFTTKGDLVGASAASTIGRLGVGSDGQALLADSSQSLGLRWGAPVAAATWNYQSKTSNYTAVANDHVTCSSTSFTVTLPTAASIAGQMIAIRHGGTSLTQVYTINTTSAQTIDGIASGVFQLFTNGEAIVVVSDGSNWQILDRKSKTDWSSEVVLSFGGGTPPTAASNATVNRIRWRRDGQVAWIYGQYETGGTATSATTGTGFYLINFPTGLVAHSNYTLNTSTTATTCLNNMLGGSKASGSYGGTNVLTGGGVNLQTTSQLRVVGQFAGATYTGWSATQNALTQVNASMQFEFPVVITGWQP